MKTKTTLILVTAAAIFAATQNSWACDDASAPTTNRALLSSPRALEEFPWLARKASATTASDSHSETAVSIIKKNRALAASPRTLEQFPELARAGRETNPAKSGEGVSQLAEVTRNRALAASPRILEVFPQLTRRIAPPSAGESIEIAPLK